MSKRDEIETRLNKQKALYTNDNRNIIREDMFGHSSNLKYQY